jgi:molybdopterin synthase sulfur carrier subunit
MTIILFGITREIVGASHIPVPDNQKLKTVADLKTWLYGQYPDLKQLKSIAVAVDHAYAEDHEALGAATEIALIPPVSGG